jgi:molybdopterin molybdotransferase
MAASVGRSHLAVIRRPRVAILASGDELVDVSEFTEVLAGRRIVSSNSYALAAQLLESGMEPVLLGIARDDPDELRRHLQKAKGCDAVISSAGVSVGEHDHLRDVVRSLDTRIAFWRVRMRPGSPFVFGQIGALGGIPWFGLPGNPVSTMVTFEVFVRPALLRMAGHRAVFARTVDVRFRDTYPAKAGLTHFVRARLDAASGEASLTGSQSSGVLSSMSAADALLVVPEDRPGALPGDVLPAVVLGGAPLQEAPGY